MPVNVGGTFVEQVRHVDIETPLWRIVEDANPAVQLSEESSSDEVGEASCLFPVMYKIQQRFQLTRRCRYPILYSIFS